MRPQSGLTLIEVAIILVIVGLLVGAVIKGQELVNNARVRNLAHDFRSVPNHIYDYQDKFRALPGDDANVTYHVTDGTQATTPATGGAARGNGVIEGAWNTTANTDESCLIWQHVRLAGFAQGSTTVDCTANSAYWPKNSEGGQIGLQSRSGFTSINTLTTGTYVVCSQGILGKFVKLLDFALDDRDTAGGSMQAIRMNSPDGAAAATSTIDDSLPYTVCMGF